MTMSNHNQTNVRYCITCEQLLIRHGLITCYDCEKILDIIATSPVPSFQATNNKPTEPRVNQVLCCMCASPTMLGSQFCSECECSMAMVLEDPVYALDVDVPAPPSKTHVREVTQDMKRSAEDDDDSDEEIEVVAELTETELMMQRYEEARESGDVVELLDDDDEGEESKKPAPSKTTAGYTYEKDDEVEFIACRTVI